MVENATGLVLRIRPLTETSLIVHWLTRDQGRLATVAKGALRPKSPFRGKLDLFYHADLSFTRSRHSDLHTLNEVNLLDTHPLLRESIELLQQVSYCQSLIETATETDTPLPQIYSLFHELVTRLTPAPPRPETVLAFELRLLNELGLAPDFSQADLDPGTGSLARALLSAPPGLLSQVQGSAEQQRQLALYLHGFLLYHLGRIPRGRNAALTLH